MNNLLVKAKSFFRNKKLTVATMLAAVVLLCGSLALGLALPKNSVYAEEEYSHEAVFGKTHVKATGAKGKALTEDVLGEDYVYDVNGDGTNIVYILDSTKPNASGETYDTFYLSADIEVTTTIILRGHINLCLNGYALTYSAGANHSVLTIDDVTDSSDPTFHTSVIIDDCWYNKAEGEYGTKQEHKIVDPNKTGATVSARSIYLNGGVIAGGTGETLAVADNGGYENSNTTVSDTDKTYGGGIFVCNGATLTMYGGLVSCNSADNGAGVYVDDGATFNLKNGTISHNKAYDTEMQTVTVEATEEGGEATEEQVEVGIGNGGGIYVEKGATFTTSTDGAISFTYNTANGNGGAIYNKSTIAINKVTFGGLDDEINSEGIKTGSKISAGNTAGNNGGAIYSEGTLTVNEATITQNAATLGGGVYFDGTTLEIDGATISNNVATSDGGGLYVTTSTSSDGVVSNTSGVTIKSGTITYNTSGNDGGGIYTIRPLTITNATISNNAANADSGYGGGINGTADLTITNSTISYNTSKYAAGINYRVGTVKMYTTTVSNNEAVTTTGGVAINYGTFIMYSGTISDNKAGSYNGGGVTVANATFIMEDGLITRNTASNCGGGVEVYNNGTSDGIFIMNGGTISYNVTTNNSGAGVYANGEFIMNGGIIDNNTAKSCGGGICVAGMTYGNGNRFIKIYNGQITNNKAYLGAGIYVDGGNDSDTKPQAYLLVEGGLISGNISTGNGGGIYSASPGIAATSSSAAISGVTINDGTIANNTANGSGGGVYNSGTLTINGGLIGGEVLKDTSTSTDGTTDGSTDSSTTTESKLEGNLSNASGGGIYNGGTLTINDGTIKYNTAHGSGGGISANGYSTLTINGGDISYNAVILTGSDIKYGGGINSNGDITITGGTISNNTAAYVGGIMWGGDSTKKLTISGGEISYNKGTGTEADQAGGILIYSAGAAIISGGSIHDNTSATHGGGITARNLNGETNTLTITDGKIYNNTAGGNGGGVSVGTTLTITGGEISNNKASGSGGGVSVADTTATFTMKGGEISNNTASSSGGGVYNSGTMQMNGGTITNNRSTGAGSAIYTRYNLVIYGGEISYNYTSDSGTIFQTDGTIVINGGSIIHNTCYWYGAALYSQSATSEDKLAITISGGYIAYNSSRTSVIGFNSAISKNRTIKITGGQIVYNTVGNTWQTIESTATSVQISGNPVIRYNYLPDGKEANVYVSTGTLKIVGLLTYGADIGLVSGTGSAKTLSTGYKTYMGAADPGKFFTLDSASGNYKLSVDTNGELCTVAAGTHDGYTATALSASTTKLENGYYYLSSDTTITDQISVTGNVVLCLNGHVLRTNTTNKRIFELTSGSGATLTIQDCSPTNAGSSSETCYTYRTVTDPTSDSGATVFIKGGLITGQSSTYYAAIDVWAGTTLIINGGTIAGNNTYCVICDYSNVTMNGGTIAYNSAIRVGAGVQVSGSSALFTMNDGAIKNNITSAHYGGGVYVYNATFNMNGGTISGNKCSSGGGVSVNSDGLFTMYGGTISDNTASYGGGIYSQGITVIENGTISGNTASYGGGIYAISKLTMNGGIVSNNKASGGTGGGICVTGNATINGGEISGNTAATYGGGIDNAGGTVTINDCLITGNRALKAGGGISSGGTITINGGTIKGNYFGPVPADGELEASTTLDTDLDEIHSSEVNIGTNSVFEMNGGTIIGNGIDDLSIDFWATSAKISGDVYISSMMLWDTTVDVSDLGKNARIGVALWKSTPDRDSTNYYDVTTEEVEEEVADDSEGAAEGATKTVTKTVTTTTKHEFEHTNFAVFATGYDKDTLGSNPLKYFVAVGNDRYSIKLNDDGELAVVASASGSDYVETHNFKVYGDNAWTWADDNLTATVKIKCYSDCQQILTVAAKVTTVVADGKVTYTATATYNGQTFTDSKEEDFKLISLSATYDGTAATTATTLDELKDHLEVVAKYSDGSTKTLTATEYSLAGSLLEGENTIKVYDGDVKTYVTIENVTKATVAKPTMTGGTGLTYNGKAQSVTIATSDYYTISGTLSATDAGTYTVNVILKDNYAWTDGGDKLVTFTWTIAKIKLTSNDVTVSINTSSESLVDGAKLPDATVNASVLIDGASVTVPGTFEWIDEVLVAGQDTYSFRFTPTDSAATNFEVYEGETSLDVKTVDIARMTFAFTQGGKVYPTTSLATLKQWIQVTGYTNAEPDKAIDIKAYELRGTLTVGTSKITIWYSDDYNEEIEVTVSAIALESITATYEQTDTLYVTSETLTVDMLESIGTLTVSGTNNDGNAYAGTITGYTVSGNITTAGTKVVTISYVTDDSRTLTCTINVVVTAIELDSITATFTQGSVSIMEGTELATLKTMTVTDSTDKMLVVKAVYNDGHEEVLGDDDYELWGSLAEVNQNGNVITVNYNGQYATFKVVVTQAKHTHVYRFSNFDWEHATRENGVITKVTVNFVCYYDSEGTAHADTSAIDKDVLEATCTTAGYIIYTAELTYEGVTYTSSYKEEVAALNHGIVLTDAGTYDTSASLLDNVAATSPVCATGTAGNSEYWVCTKCGKIFSDANATTEITLEDVTIEATHTFTNTQVVDPTCDEQGYTSHDCTVCKQTIIDTYVPATGHDYANSTWVWSSDCQYAYATFVCNNGKGTATEHSVQIVASTGSGITRETTTEGSATVIKYTAEISFNGKTWTDEHTVNDDAHDDNYVIASGPEWVMQYTAEGSYYHVTATYSCSICGKTKTAEADATLVNTKPATCFAEGLSTYQVTLKIDGYAKEFFYTKEDKLAQLTHWTTRHEAIGGTSCTDAGQIEYWYCSNCDKYYTDEDCTQEIAFNETYRTPSGHTYSAENITWAWSDDLGKATAFATCTVCGNIVPVEAVITDNAATTTDGWITYTATIELKTGEDTTATVSDTRKIGTPETQRSEAKEEAIKELELYAYEQGLSKDDETLQKAKEDIQNASDDASLEDLLSTAKDGVGAAAASNDNEVSNGGSTTNGEMIALIGIGVMIVAVGVVMIILVSRRKKNS